MDLLTFFNFATVAVTLLICILLMWKPFSRKATHLEKGLEYLRNNADEKAIASFTKAISDNPVYFDAYEIRAATFLKTGDFDSASADVETMIKQQPDNHRGYLLRSQIHSENGDFEAMLDDLNIAVEIEPSATKAYELRANAFVKLQQYAKAVEELTQIIDVIGDTKFQHYLQRGGFFMLAGQIEKSISDLNVAYERAIGQRERYSALTVRFKAFTQCEQYEKAIKDASEMIYIHPKKALGYIARAEVYQLEQQYEEALADSVKAIELNPQELQAYLNRFNVYMVGFKNYEKALGNANHIMEFNEKTGLFCRSSALSRMLRLDDAIADLDKVIIIDPDNSEFYNSRAWFKAYIGDYNNALEDADKAISLKSDVSRHWGTRGTIKWLLGEYQDALIDFEKAEEIIESGFVHTVEIAVTLVKFNKQNEAIQAWKTSISGKSKYQTAEAYQETYLFAPPFYEAMQELEKLAKDN